ncbi:MAG: IclR family transcriptional regulator [Dehalococcoidia bacterium]|nr:IclR family transcriptional regulator [Dehalococcoidia bacterium]
MGKAAYYQIKSIVKAFRLMELLVTKNEFQLAELCQLLQSPKTTIHRMLLTLESLGYVQQNPKSLGYMASIKIFDLGGKVVQNLNFIEIARPLMIGLSEKSGETINLGVLDGLDIICIDKIESKYHLKLDQPIGSRAKAYDTAMGKAILAYLSEEERARLFSKYSISPSASKSLKTVSAIEEDLQTVREQGYSVDDEEYIIGVRCVGAPIFDHNSKVVAGLSIAGPALRIKERNIGPLAKLVRETAAFISNRLGTLHEK